MSARRLTAWSTAVVVSSACLVHWAGGSQPAYVDHHPHDAVVFSAPGAEPHRSGKWPAVRDAYLRQHPTCEACGSRKDLNVHHIAPYHLNPEKELDPTNFVTLCRTHHLTIGHACGDKPGHDNWSCANPNVRKDAAEYRRRGH